MANGDEGQQGQQGGGIATEDAGPTIEDTLRDLGAGGGDLAVQEGAEEGGQPAAQEGAPESGPEPAGPEPTGEEATEGGAQELPEGFSVEEDSQGREHIRGPDGRYYAREDVMAEGADAEPLPTEEEAAEFFEGEEGGEPEHTVEIELEAEDEDSEPEVLEIGTDDEETANRIRQMQEDAKEARELRAEIADLQETRAEVQRDLQEAELLEEEIRMDPSGFVVERLPEERRAEVLRDIMLFDDEAFAQAQELIDQWGTGRAGQTDRREARLDRKEELSERREKLDNLREQARQAQEMGQKVVNALRDRIPQDMSAKRAEMFLEDAVSDVERHLERNEISVAEFDIDKLPELISRRLEVYGIEWNQTTDGRSSSGPRTAKPAGEEEAELAAKAEEARKTGARLRRAHARRKQAGQSAPSGAGSPGTSARPPQGAKLEDALDFARERAG